MNMKNKTLLTMTLLALTIVAQAQTAGKVVRQVNFSHVKITDDFWAPRLDRHVTTTQPVCIDQIENQTGRIRNFINAGRGESRHSGIFFDDSDVYKAMEGMAYSLINHPDKLIEAKMDQWIDYMEKAQQPDGYINTFYTLTGLDNRWTDMDKHEMYCTGHMIEAAVAYYQATGKDQFLKVAQRMVGHIMSLFGPGKRHWVPGHEEIELALVKLYELTGNEDYLDFAYWLLEERGHGHGFRPDGQWNAAYYQDNIPVRDMESIGGHAVRLMYLFCGMADVTAYKETGYIETLNRLWHDVVDRNMYITGGIGQTATNEGFSEDYSLPNATAYCETCASIGMVLWNYRMNQFTGEAKYIDVLERAMYNGVLAGINLRGDRFFYVNPLESAGNHHRQAWFGCACCPSNITRFLPSIGNYIYGTSTNTLWVNLYIGNKATVKIDGQQLPIEMKTLYPWDGNIRLNIGKALGKKQLRLRIPGWCNDFSIAVNGNPFYTFSQDKGYAIINRNWKQGDFVEIKLTMPVERVNADPRVKEDLGMQAIQRGPLVYCAEAIDNAGSYDDFLLTPSTQFTLRQLGGILNGTTGVTADNGQLQLQFIPYYAWDNREPSKMKVWVKETE